MLRHLFFRESLERRSRNRIGETIHIEPQRWVLLYLDDKMTASAGTKSLPFTLIISPTSTCGNKLVTALDYPHEPPHNMKIHIYGWKRKTINRDINM